MYQVLLRIIPHKFKEARRVTVSFSFGLLSRKVLEPPKKEALLRARPNEEKKRKKKTKTGRSFRFFIKKRTFIPNDMKKKN